MKQTRASRAFGVQSSSFDQTYGPSPIVRFKRNRVRELLIPYLPERASILELNGGTGEDALFFRGLGHSVTYTDLSDGMIEQARKKFKESEWEDIRSIQASFEDLSGIVETFDVVFSNLGGLNCTPDLPAVLDQVD
ncbi:MAG: class I SAM-dependent methyltransferase, partial [Bacteroidota bacterium]|nr:class I SAM-dependent methyltransferase [Bacteroidota bacterium]MDX5506358.1 class I SAM-dependent methyltransferase [Bacteroidota bacterium]